ncbi:MAG: hypothetical protein ACU843_11840 [Gammaproteobacteria bacterium]
MEQSAAQLGRLLRKPVPIETFEIIVTDECHRSIYNLWAQVDANLSRPERLRQTIHEQLSGSGLPSVYGFVSTQLSP